MEKHVPSDKLLLETLGYLALEVSTWRMRTECLVPDGF